MPPNDPQWDPRVPLVTPGKGHGLSALDPSESSRLFACVPEGHALSIISVGVGVPRRIGEHAIHASTPLIQIVTLDCETYYDNPKLPSLAWLPRLQRLARGWLQQYFTRGFWFSG